MTLLADASCSGRLLAKFLSRGLNERFQGRLRRASQCRRVCAGRVQWVYGQGRIDDSDSGLGRSRASEQKYPTVRLLDPLTELGGGGVEFLLIELAGLCDPLHQ